MGLPQLEDCSKGNALSPRDSSFLIFLIKMYGKVKSYGKQNLFVLFKKIIILSDQAALSAHPSYLAVHNISTVVQRKETHW